jgi:hypothetical protein
MGEVAVGLILTFLRLPCRIGGNIGRSHRPAVLSSPLPWS